MSCAGVRHEFKRPESVLVVVYTARGEVLLLRRCSPRDYWQSVTGSLGWREKPAAAARRELCEETGLRVARGGLRDCGYTNRFPVIFPWKRRYAPRVRYNHEHVYGVELARPRIVRLNPGEHTACRWMPWRQAALLAASWTNREAIVRLLG